MTDCTIDGVANLPWPWEWRLLPEFHLLLIIQNPSLHFEDCVRVHNDIVQHALHKSQRDFSRSGTGRSGWIDALTNVDCQHCRITRIDEPRIELAAVDVDAVVTCLMAVRYDKQLSIRKVLLQCAQS